MSITGQETKYVNNSDAINQDLGDRYVSKQYIVDNYGNILPDRLKGGLWAWGRNLGPIFAEGSPEGTGSGTPKYTGVYDDWSYFNISDLHAMGVKRDGTLWGWGTNNTGQLGLGDTIARSTPTQVGLDNNWTYVNANGSSTAAIKTDGTLWVCGFNGGGQLGLGDIISRSTLTQVGSSANWSLIKTGGVSIAIKTDGTLWSWGDNTYGQLGLGDTIHRSSPVQVGTLTDWETIGFAQGGVPSSSAIKTDGTLWVWGWNDRGQLGLGDLVHRSSPVQIGSDTDWSVVSTVLNTIAIKNNGTMWATGSGSLTGIGDALNKSTLTQVGAATDWKYVHVSSSAVCAIKTNGTLWVWGSNGNGRLGINSTTPLIPVQSNPYRTWRYAQLGFYNSIGFRVGGYF